MENFQDEIRSALAKYEDSAKHRLPQTTLEGLRGVKTLDDLARQIEASGATFRDFRAKNGRIWSSLEKFIGPVVGLLGIAANASSNTPYGPPAVVVMGAVIWLVSACEGVSKAYDWIEQVFFELQEFTARLEIYARSPMDQALGKKITAILAFVIQVIGRCERLVRERRFRQYMKVVFLGKDPETSQLANSLNKLFGSEQQLVLAVTYASTQRSEQTTHRIEQSTKTLSETLHKTDQNVRYVLGSVIDAGEKTSKAEENQVLKQSLCATQTFEYVEETFYRNKRTLLEGTGSWLQQEPLYKAWTARNATILWIFGGPGTGKSYLSTWIVKQCFEQHDREFPVAYFFVRENNENLRDANIILKTLAWQISEQDPAFRSHAVNVCSQRKYTITAADTWENLFLQYYVVNAPEGRAATLVVDGLDEATVETRHSMLGFIRQLVTSREARRAGLQFAIVGRGSLRSDLDFDRSEKRYFIQVSQLKNQRDIDNYIKNRLGDFQLLREMRKMKPDGIKKANRLGSIIARKVTDGAGGVFLWAKLLLDGLVKKDRSQIESALAQPPSTIDEMIRSVFERLERDDGPDLEVLRKMLLFMAYSRRPLLFGELDLVTGLPSRKPNYLLWNQTRGSLSSLFDLKFPRGIDPDAETQEDDNGGTASLGNTQDEDESNLDDDEVFDFSGADDGSSTQGTSVDNDDVFGVAVDSKTSSNVTMYSREHVSEEDLFNHLSDGQLHTEVAFCHSRIRDYLVHNGNPEKKNSPPLSIIPLGLSAHREITMTCLNIFRLDTSSNEQQRFLYDYPLCHMAFHLELVDRKNTPRDQIIKIVDGLHWLFGTDQGTTCLLKSTRDYDEFRGSEEIFWQLWVATDRFMKLLQAWFMEVDSLKDHASWDESVCIWMRKAASSLEELLRPVMLSALSIWLKKPGFGSTEYFNKQEFRAYQVHAWMTWVETGSAPPLSEKFERRKYSLKDISSDRIEHIAAWAGFDRNTHWHTCVGWALMTGEHCDSAVSHFQRAIDLDPEAWVALEGLGICAGLQRQWKEGITWHKKSIAQVPAVLSFVNADLWIRTSGYASKMNDRPRVLSAARNGFQANSWAPHIQAPFFKALRETEEPEELISTLASMDRTAGTGLPYSQLVDSFINKCDAFDEIGWACRKQSQPQFVLDAMDKALYLSEAEGRGSLSTWLHFKIGNFKYKYYDKEEEAVRHLATFLELFPRQSEHFQKAYIENVKYATDKLAQIYFDRAVASWNSNTEHSIVMANELKKLSVVVDTSFRKDYDGFDLFRNGYPSVLWGRWLRDHRQTGDSEWRKIVRPTLLECMNCLDDDDPANDTDALVDLAMALFHAGDRLNAGAIVAILFQHFEDELKAATDDNPAERQPAVSKPEDAQAIQPPSAIEPDALKLHIDDHSWLCSNCQLPAPKASEFYLCELCPNSNWCSACLTLLRDPDQVGTPSTRLCNPEHDFYCAWPIPDSARHAAAQSLGNDVFVRKAWLEDLRDEWWRQGI